MSEARLDFRQKQNGPGSKFCRNYEIILNIPEVTPMMGLIASQAVTLMRLNFVALCTILLILYSFASMAPSVIPVPSASSHKCASQLEAAASLEASTTLIAAVGMVAEVKTTTPKTMRSKNAGCDALTMRDWR